MSALDIPKEFKRISEELHMSIYDTVDGKDSDDIVIGNIENFLKTYAEDEVIDANYCVSYLKDEVDENGIFFRVFKILVHPFTGWFDITITLSIANSYTCRSKLWYNGGID